MVLKSENITVKRKDILGISIIEEYTKAYCKSEILDKKLSSSGRRITVSLPCDIIDYNCAQQNNTIIDLISKLESKIDRVDPLWCPLNKW